MPGSQSADRSVAQRRHGPLAMSVHTAIGHISIQIGPGFSTQHRTSRRRDYHEPLNPVIPALVVELYPPCIPLTWG